MRCSSSNCCVECFAIDVAEPTLGRTEGPSHFSCSLERQRPDMATMRQRRDGWGCGFGASAIDSAYCDSRFCDSRRFRLCTILLRFFTLRTGTRYGPEVWSMDALCKPPYNALRLAQASAMQFSHCAWCGLYAETSDIVRSQCTGSIVCTRHSFTLSAEINQEGGRDRTSIHTMSPI